MKEAIHVQRIKPYFFSVRITTSAMYKNILSVGKKKPTNPRL